MKEEAGLSVLAIGTCCAKAGVVPATNARASRIFCIGGLPLELLQANTATAGQPAGFPLSAAVGCCYSRGCTAWAGRGQGNHEQKPHRACHSGRAPCLPGGRARALWPACVAAQ